MPSLIWEPADQEAERLEYGKLSITAEVRKGEVYRVIIHYGPSEKAWTIQDLQPPPSKPSLLA